MFNNEKKKVELGKSQETMILPLWGRFLESKKTDPLIYDSKAIEIINNIDYDFSKIEKKLTEYHALAWAVRSKTMDLAIENFIKKHPKAVIVNIGAGLDTSFERADNGKIVWYDLDLPDAIEFRKNFIDETDRRHYISKSVFDYSWFDDIKEIDDNILFIASGVLMFFKEEYLKQLFCEFTSKFPNGEIFFDTLSEEGLKYANDMMTKAGMEEGMIEWGVNSANEITKWNDKIEVVDEFSYYERIPRKKEWSNDVVELMNICDKMKSANFYHLKFK
ncbi:MAG: class I SAM-dependent methyltransferase [Tepidibacter sp.]|jgi:O-methyltransferase involved in polyketide biosynthesis|uniref:class I SAM-dependent methyltransferase n=1 Tax=Tepidibacter sp. TaxID=2529387 RepID=UPI0025FD363B|nr:class I SAM-dependent methyltransferase [Tepidibacter sp.]MCT4509618.1 class I SAM-dependent methyltransferase [Tepidibacter sp.]